MVIEDLNIKLVTGEELVFSSVTNYSENGNWICFTFDGKDFAIKEDNVVYFYSKET